ncbi:MAG: tRNA pseudouridine(55) synthase TruB [Bacilli bacterium]|nr:tRNA pseudouridine(55) synthase TruB [Bacilli bacterium]
MDGILLINKERGWTSRDVCNKLQKILNEKSIGHLGTLDPFAEGLLAVTIGKANKIMQFTEHLRKTYIADLYLGVETNTGDLTGEVTNKKDVKDLSETEIRIVLKSFLGKIMQVPPMTSAVHHQGRKLYEIAHEGEVVERKPREVEIFELKFISYHDHHLIFETTVSKGTYIRVLGEDIAKKLETVGHLYSLLRTKIGPLDISNAVKISDVNENVRLYPITRVLTHFARVKLPPHLIKKVMDGQNMSFGLIDYEYILIIDEDGEAIAIYKREGNSETYRCFRGLW